ncbi:hypothetical protein [Bordetella genomosp. 12]|uniref:hypothetical protein n=1 Tax=Bordetella genomosp. 12 TaxID=463035 RepID=UPI001178A515|nr:hypothetical protein [Bordetella genomosp. 12]
MLFSFRIIEDKLGKGNSPVFLPRAARGVYVVAGDVTIETDCSRQLVRAASSWINETAATFHAGSSGTHLLRWELVSLGGGYTGRLKSAPESESVVRMDCEVDLDPAFEWLLRCDQVSFPAGSAAPVHMHQGPGLRYVLTGELDAIGPGGVRHIHRPGDVFIENGIDEPVSAVMSQTETTAFVRGLLLPRSVKGLGSTRFVHAEDRVGPKSQTYTVFGERYISLPGHSQGTV